MGREAYEYGAEIVWGLSLLQTLRYWRFTPIELLNTRIVWYNSQLGLEDDLALNGWEKQFENFCDNVVVFYQHTGSEVDELALPRETINNLRKFASNRRQELAPLLEENARLHRDLTSYKRINAALQTRHTIEKLVFELPNTTPYNVRGSGRKWQALWNKIWTDASQNVNNPFHNLWTQSGGNYARDNIRDKGQDLFADMSGEIHGYEQKQGKVLDYEHFDASARKVAQILHDKPVIDQNTGDVDWANEVLKYPV